MNTHSEEITIDEYYESRRTRNRFGRNTLVTLLAAATFFGTFQSIDTKVLERNHKKEAVTGVYNVKGSSLGICLGGLQEIYGDMYGIQIGGIPMQGISDNVYGAQIGLAQGACNVYGLNLGGANMIQNELKGIQVGIYNEGNYIDNYYDNKNYYTQMISDTLKQSLTGLQVGIFNSPYEVKLGACLGLNNHAERSNNSIQVGLHNSINTAEGFYFQLGLWNTTDKKNALLVNTGYNKPNKK